MAQPTSNPFAGVLTSWKTTAPAAVMAAVTLLQTLGVLHLTPESLAAIGGFLVAVIGVFARDANKSSSGNTVAPDPSTSTGTSVTPGGA